MSNMRFECPTCGQHRIAEVVSGVTITAVLTDIHTDGKGNVDVDFSDVTENHLDAVTIRYQCFGCGNVLRDHGEVINNAANLSKYLVADGMLTEEVL